MDLIEETTCEKYLETIFLTRTGRLCSDRNNFRAHG